MKEKLIMVLSVVAGFVLWPILWPVAVLSSEEEAEAKRKEKQK